MPKLCGFSQNILKRQTNGKNYNPILINKRIITKIIMIYQIIIIISFKLEDIRVVERFKPFETKYELEKTRTFDLEIYFVI